MPLELPLVDIIIPVFGEFERVAKCVEACLALEANYKFTVTLVDDASPDKKAAIEFYDQYKGNKRVSVYKNKENVGYGATVTKGFKMGYAPLVLFLNSDVLLQPDALYNMVTEFDDPAVGVVGALLTFSEDSPNGPARTVQHAGMVIDLLGKPYHVHLGWSPDHPRVQQRRKLQCVTGACLMTRRKLFQAIGFNPAYGRGTFEDVQYCLTVHSSKLDIVFQPKVRGTHYTGASAIGAQIKYPLRENYQTFLATCKGMFIWDEFEHW